MTTLYQKNKFQETVDNKVLLTLLSQNHNKAPIHLVL
ncbi:MAG: hypothetical protein ACJA17_000314 [Polaribacter sp.]|jgi:hypothetical protein